jgi:hypothetical protein
MRLRNTGENFKMFHLNPIHLKLFSAHNLVKKSLNKKLEQGMARLLCTMKIKEELAHTVIL